uniref:CR1-alpha n=1 Tax=Simian adenovirus 13 TaxID=38432 RepID=A0A1W5PVA1_9ADEN|nr:CR1-alpha [Simian adenovirus 13]
MQTSAAICVLALISFVSCVQPASGQIDVCQAANVTVTDLSRPILTVKCGFYNKPVSTVFWFFNNTLFSSFNPFSLLISNIKQGFNYYTTGNSLQLFAPYSSGRYHCKVLNCTQHFFIGIKPPTPAPTTVTTTTANTTAVTTPAPATTSLTTASTTTPSPTTTSAPSAPKRSVRSFSYSSLSVNVSDPTAVLRCSCTGNYTFWGVNGTDWVIIENGTFSRFVQNDTIKFNHKFLNSSLNLRLPVTPGNYSCDSQSRKCQHLFTVTVLYPTPTTPAPPTTATESNTHQALFAPSETPEPATASTPWWLFVVVGIIVVIIAGAVTAFFVYKKHPEVVVLFHKVPTSVY